MARWKIILTVLLISLILFLAGDANNEIIEIQNNAATMCMACIGLE